MTRPIRVTVQPTNPTAARYSKTVGKNSSRLAELRVGYSFDRRNGNLHSKDKITATPRFRRRVAPARRSSLPEFAADSKRPRSHDKLSVARDRAVARPGVGPGRGPGRPDGRVQAAGEHETDGVRSANRAERERHRGHVSRRGPDRVQRDRFFHQQRDVERERPDRDQRVGDRHDSRSQEPGGQGVDRRREKRAARHPAGQPDVPATQVRGDRIVLGTDPRRSHRVLSELVPRVQRDQVSTTYLHGVSRMNSPRVLRRISASS